jgi:amino acid transporter
MGANEVLAASQLDKRSKLLGHRSARFDTPDGLYYVMGILSTFLLVLNFALAGDANDIFWTILSFSFVIFMLPYLFMFPAAVKLRRIDTKTERPYRVPGGKGGLLLCAVICELCIALSIVFLFKDAGSGLPLWTLIIGTIVTTFFGWLLIKAGDKKK